MNNPTGFSVVKLDMAQPVYHQRVSVDFDFPVVFCRGAFAPGAPWVADALKRRGEKRRHKVMVAVEDAVAAASPKLLDRIRDWFAAEPCAELVRAPWLGPGGEAIKNDYRRVMEFIDLLLEFRMDRHAAVIAIGGGAFLDAVGFATALVHRGLRLIRLPTTVLAQDDAGVGVKNAINLHGGKNTIGTFAPPFAVINDFDFLDTLPAREWTAGISEAFKVAMIKDARFFRDLCVMAPRLQARDRAAMEELVTRCALLHLEHISTSGDPFELGAARPLDFGHWSAHKLEGMTGYEVHHGEAVAMGLALDAGYAVRKGWLTAADGDALINGLTAAGFRLWHPALLRRLGDGRLEILGGLDDFREHLGGELCVTMPKGVGAKFEIHEMDPALIEASLLDLQARTAPAR
jgi:3-dehydroquinate synthase